MSLDPAERIDEPPPTKRVGVNLQATHRPLVVVPERQWGSRFLLASLLFGGLAFFVSGGGALALALLASACAFLASAFLLGRYLLWIEGQHLRIDLRLWGLLLREERIPIREDTNASLSRWAGPGGDRCVIGICQGDDETYALGTWIDLDPESAAWLHRALNTRLQAARALRP